MKAVWLPIFSKWTYHGQPQGALLLKTNFERDLAIFPMAKNDNYCLCIY